MPPALVPAPAAPAAPAPSAAPTSGRAKSRNPLDQSAEPFHATLNEVRKRPAAGKAEASAKPEGRAKAGSPTSAKADRAAKKARKEASQAKSAQSTEPVDAARPPQQADQQTEATPVEAEVVAPEIDIDEKAPAAEQDESAADEAQAIDPVLLVPYTPQNGTATADPADEEAAAEVEVANKAPVFPVAPRPVAAVQVKPLGDEAESGDAEAALAEDQSPSAQGEIDPTELADLAEAVAEELAPEETPAAPQTAAVKTAPRPTQEARPNPQGAVVQAGESTSEQSAQSQGQADLQMPQSPMAGETTTAKAPAEKEFAGELKAATDGRHEDAARSADAAAPRTPQVIEREAARPAAPTPLRSFVQDNHETIVNSVRTQLLPNGGSMQIRLNPGDLGELHISVRVIDGALSATLQTSSDDATRLLSHSLSQLKHSLESQGVSVDRIQVTQAPREPQPSRGDDGQPQHRDNPGRQQQQEAMHQDQQRRHLLNRMWARMAAGEDPLDLVA